VPVPHNFWKGSILASHLSSGRWPVGTLCLVAVMFYWGAASASALDQHGCVENPQTLALIEQGSNEHLPAAARESAYRKAIKLCPAAPAGYDGLAVLLLKLRQSHDALQWIHQGLGIAPGNPALMHDLGVALLLTGEPERALKVLANLPPGAQGEFYEGMAYAALRDHDAARQAFSKAFAMGDNDPYVLYELINEDRALHNEKQGLRDFQMFDERFPHSAWLHLLLGNAYTSRHDARSAESEYRQAAQIDPKLPLVHYNLGRLAFDQARYAGALREFEKEIDVDQTFGEAYLYLGATLRRLGMNREAIPYLEDAVARDPNFPLAYRELAVAQVQAKQSQAAFKTLREGERRFPKEAAFPAQLAGLLRQLGEFREAAEQSTLAEALSGKSNVLLGVVSPPPVRAREPASAGFPQVQQLEACLRREDAQCASRIVNRADGGQFVDNPDYLNLKAEALNLLHEETPALAAAQRAIALDPHRAGFLITAGRINQKLGHQAAAIQCFLNAERLQPGSESPVYYAGMSFFMLGYDNNDNGYYDRAGRHFKAAVELNPRDDRAVFMLGVIDSIEFKFAEARKYLAEALKMKPRNPYYHLHYGLLLSHTGDLAGGQREMKVAEMLDPSYPSTYLRLGDLDAQMGEYEGARKQLETAVRLDPRLSSAYYTLGQVYYRLGLTAKSRTALMRFQQAKTQEQRAEDPIGASINAVISRAPTEGRQAVKR
jgi:tetratricopeptide (TPR) repeat protein